MTFVASANCIEYVGAKPFFVDTETDTGNINIYDLEKALKKLNKVKKSKSSNLCRLCRQYL